MELLYILLLVAVSIFFMVKIYLDDKGRKKKHLKLIKESWGKPAKREYSYEEFESISHYYRRRAEGRYTVDDITWNDLDMDRIFMLMNHTQSSMGQEYLYEILRCPVFDREILERREELIQYVDEHEEDRVQIQKVFAMIGRTRYISLTDYIYGLDEISLQDGKSHIVYACLIPAAVVLFFLSPSVGIGALLTAICCNIVQYQRNMHKIEPYVVSFKYILSVLRGAKQLEKLDIPILEPYQEKVKASRKQFRKFEKGAWLLSSTDSTGGGLLEFFLSYIRMFFHVDFIKFYSMLKQLRDHIDAVDVMYENMGILESAIAVASFRRVLPFYCQPNLVEGYGAGLTARNLYHPLVENAVANHITVERGALITGSNASGKSTFLKTVAINAILSQTIYTSLTEYYRANCYQIFSSMALRDDLMSQESYYIVEIKSLKRILDCAVDERPVLCFVDEVLRGTNTVERIAASSQILKSLSKEQIMCFAATHDIELTYILEDYYENFHFQEEVVENDILFNYRIYEGRATSRNAIKLLSIIGYEESIIANAERTAERFVKTGEWKL